MKIPNESCFRLCRNCLGCFCYKTKHKHWPFRAGTSLRFCAFRTKICLDERVDYDPVRMTISNIIRVVKYRDVGMLDHKLQQENHWKRSQIPRIATRKSQIPKKTTLVGWLLFTHLLIHCNHFWTEPVYEEQNVLSKTFREYYFRLIQLNWANRREKKVWQRRVGCVKHVIHVHHDSNSTQDWAQRLNLKPKTPQWIHDFPIAAKNNRRGSHHHSYTQPQYIYSVHVYSPYGISWMSAAAA